LADDELLRIEALRAASRLTHILVTPVASMMTSVTGGGDPTPLQMFWSQQMWRNPTPADIVEAAERYLAFLERPRAVSYRAGRVRRGISTSE
jgi:hypothetical protein